jgi:hypothetical protein
MGGQSRPAEQSPENAMTATATRLSVLAVAAAAVIATSAAYAKDPVHGTGSSHNPIIVHPVHGPGSSHDPIIVHPVHGAGSSHDPIICRPGARPGSLDCRHEGSAR